MLWWFVETTLVAGILAGVAALLGRLRVIGPSARHLLWLVVLIKFMTPPLIHSPWAIARPQLDWPVEPARVERGPCARPEVVPVCWEPVVEAADSAPDRADPPAREAVAPPVQEAVIAEVGKVEIAEPEREPRPAVSAPRALRSTPLRSGAGWWVAGDWPRSSWPSRRPSASSASPGRLDDAVPAPAWLVEEAEELGLRLRVRVPELLAVPGLGTPMLWCLGRPKLLLPVHMIKSSTLPAGGASWPTSWPTCGAATTG